MEDRYLFKAKRIVIGNIFDNKELLDRDDKKHNKVSQKQYEKFMDLLKVGENNANSES